MNTDPTIRKIVKDGNERWEVDYGVDASGKKKRNLFKTEALAKDAITAYNKEVKSGGNYWARLSQVERQLTIGTLQDIKAKGQTLDGVWADWQRWKRDNQQTVVEPKAYEDVVAEWGRRKMAAGKSEKYVHDSTGTVLAKFGEGRERQNIHEISAADLERWIDSRCKDPKLKVQTDPLRTWGLSSRRTNTSLFSGLWEVACKCGWASLNITERFDEIGKIGRDVNIHSNETVRDLMAAVMDNTATSTRVLVVFVLGFFGCMRPEEVLSKKAIRNGHLVFGWDDIDLEHGLITVRKEIAKTGDQRTIRLQPVAVEWLKLAKELGNPLPPVNERRLRVQSAELIGFDMTKAGDDWERDGMRKNCATHLRAIYKNDYDVVKDCGNSIRVLLKHYADLHTPEQVSLEHWQISPESVEEYRKTDAWKELLIQASKVPLTLSEGENAKPAC